MVQGVARNPNAAPPAGRGAGPAGGGGGGEGGGGLTVQGLPILKPPYATITALNLNEGTKVWQVAHGETPDNIKNNPALKGLTIPRTGRQGRIGVLTTKSLVIAGEGGFFTAPNGQRGAMLRAYDKAHRPGSGRGLHAGAADRFADDLHAERQAVHHGVDCRSRRAGRVDRLQTRQLTFDGRASSRRARPSQSRIANRKSGLAEVLTSDLPDPLIPDP